MAVTAQDIANRVEILLQDETNLRWGEDELLGWIADGERETVALNPSAYTQSSTVSLVTGTRQQLPSQAVRLIDVIRNTNGRAVRIVERKVLDEQRPDWHVESQASEAKHFTHDARDPRTFFVYPPNNGSGSVETVYSAAPAAMGSITDEITLDELYMPALVNYTAFRALSKDAEYTASQQATNYYQMFQHFVQTRAQMDGHTIPGASMDAANLRMSGRRNASVSQEG